MGARQALEIRCACFQYKKISPVNLLPYAFKTIEVIFTVDQDTITEVTVKTYYHNDEEAIGE